jgi:hypothetical protein
LSPAYFKVGNIFKNYIKNNKKEIDTILDRWYKIITENQDDIQKILNVDNISECIARIRNVYTLFF